MPVESLVAGERAMLENMLDVQRGELRRLLCEVDDTQARARLVPSLTTLLGLVKHATFVEQVWFHSRVAGVPRADLGLPDTVDETFTLSQGTRCTRWVRPTWQPASIHDRWLRRTLSTSSSPGTRVR